LKRTREDYEEIKSQLTELRNKEKDIVKSLDKLKDGLAVNQDDEFETISDMAKKISEFTRAMKVLENMIKNGVELNRRRLETEEELAGIKSRIEKLSKIHAELEEVWK
jgi:chromosome segregation ATPase